MTRRPLPVCVLLRSSFDFAIRGLLIYRVVAIGGGDSAKSKEAKAEREVQVSRFMKF